MGAPYNRRPMGKNKSKAKAKKGAAPKIAKMYGTPDANDARVCIELYDLRREALMRASRETLLQWQPKSAADVAAMAEFGSEHNAAFRQVTSYFEMAFGLARRGAVHPELIAEWCGEGIFLFSKIHPFLEEIRATISPTAFRNAEWITTNTEQGAGRLAMFLDRAKTRDAAADEAEA